MDELNKQDYEDIRRFVFDNSESFPELEDLPYRWRRHAKIFKPEGSLLSETMKHELIQYYVDCSATKLWAWEGLLRLLEDTKGKEPEPLWRWACRVVRDQLEPPTKSRGSKPEHNRNFRIELAARQLQLAGLSREEAIAQLSKALRYSAKGSLKENTVQSAIQRGRKARMR